MRMNAMNMARMNSFEALIKMLRQKEREQGEDIDDAKEVGKDEMGLLDHMDNEEAEQAPEDSSQDTDKDDDDDFEAQKREFMQRDNKIGKPVKGSSRLMFLKAQDPKKGFKGAKGF